MDGIILIGNTTFYFGAFEILGIKWQSLELKSQVIDEADRLLQQSYHDWLEKVLQATHNKTSGRIIEQDG